jgi:hypothetical protein
LGLLDGPGLGRGLGLVGFVGGFAVSHIAGVLDVPSVLVLKGIFIDDIPVVERIRVAQLVGRRPEQATHRVDDPAGQPDKTSTPAESATPASTAESAAQIAHGQGRRIAKRRSPVRSGLRCGSGRRRDGGWSRSERSGGGGRQRRRGVHR